MTDLPKLKLTYTDSSHSYYMNGRRAKSVSGIAKIPVESWTIEQWDRRQVAIGLTLDKSLTETIAMDIENREAIDDCVKQAKRVAGAHRKADRGTQMHRVLELVLLDREDELLTDQQRQDAEVLKRTLDRYKLTPVGDLVEQFVAYPTYTICGRFDGVLERADNTRATVDLKSGPNAVKYPQSTSVQLALYARAPMISQAIHQRGERTVVEEWRTLPDNLDRSSAYVLLVEPGSKCGTFHRIDIEHGWRAAAHALEIVKWRKELRYGDDIAQEVMPDLENPLDVPDFDDDLHQEYLREARRAKDRGVCVALWRSAKAKNLRTDELRAALRRRTKELER